MLKQQLFVVTCTTFVVPVTPVRTTPVLNNNHVYRSKPIFSGQSIECFQTRFHAQSSAIPKGTNPRLFNVQNEENLEVFAKFYLKE